MAKKTAEKPSEAQMATRVLKGWQISYRSKGVIIKETISPPQHNCVKQDEYYAIYKTFKTFPTMCVHM